MKTIKLKKGDIITINMEKIKNIANGSAAYLERINTADNSQIAIFKVHNTTTIEIEDGENPIIIH